MKDTPAKKNPAAKKPSRKCKIIIGIIIAVLVLLLLSLHWLGVIITPAAKLGASTIGKKATGCDITFDNIELSLICGRLVVNNFKISNPEGYETPSIFEVEKINVKLQPLSVFKDTVVVELVEIRAPQITYEVGLGNSNVGTLLSNIEKFSAAEEQAENAEAEKPEQDTAAEAAAEPGKKVVIDHVEVSDGSIHLAAKLTGGHALPIPLPTLTMNDIGREKENDGTSIIDASCKILTGIFTSVGQVIGDAAKWVGDAAVSAGKAVGNAAASAGKAIGGAASSAGKAIGDAAGSAFEGVKGLFTSGDDKK